MSTTPSQVLVHLIGHHELYLEFEVAGQHVLALHKSSAAFSVGKELVKRLDGATSPGDVHGRIALPSQACLGWSAGKVEDRLEWRASGVSAQQLAEAPLVAVRSPLLAAVLAAARADDSGARLQVVLVTAGPTEKVPERGASTETIGKALLLAIGHGTLGPVESVTHQHFVTPNPHDFAGSHDLLRRISARIAEHRRAVVNQHQLDWKSHFRVAVSVNTGPIPLITALITGLEAFHPRLLTVPEARRWPEAASGPRKFIALTSRVLEVDEVRQRPATQADDFADDAVVQCAINAMRSWRDDFCAARPQRAKDLVEEDEALFWFRKGRKEVLAVLVVRESDGALRAFRGVNLEVSLPTGTLCAERNVIGSALAHLPMLHRRQIEAVAVLSLSGKARLGPCGACREWLLKVAEVNPDLRVITFDDVDATRVIVEPAL